VRLRHTFNLPPHPTTPHEVKDSARTHPQVRHPTKMLHLVIAQLSVLDKIDPHVHVRDIERHVIDKAKAMLKTCGTVVSFIVDHAPGVLRRLHLLEQKGLRCG
jgi:hypothetical protein